MSTDAGEYSLQVWVRNAGSTAPYDAWLSTETPFEVHPAITNVILMAPFQGTTFNAPSSITVAAAVTSNVAVVSVKFYAGSNLIGSSTATPYQTSWSSPALGSHVITAVATDSGETRRLHSQ
jgi:hypothetical protein